MNKENTDKIELSAKKLGMTQLFNEDRKAVPVTVLELENSVVTQLKTEENDGYSAVQVSHELIREKLTSKALKGHQKKAGSDPRRNVHEFPVAETSDYELGAEIGLSSFEEGQTVDVIGVSKGKGFQGVVKKYGFAGGPQTHGSMSHRRPGSIGHCQWPGEVRKGQKMPGQTGGKQITVQNLVIVKIVPEKNLMLVKGSIPGANGSILRVRKSKKTKNRN